MNCDTCKWLKAREEVYEERLALVKKKIAAVVGRADSQDERVVLQSELLEVWRGLGIIFRLQENHETKYHPRGE